jgi:hypothetical protein
MDVGELLRTTFRRSLWLLETLGTSVGQDRVLLMGVTTILETFRRCGPLLNVAEDDFTGVFHRVADDRVQLPMLRGAATGVLWNLKTTDINLQAFAQPDQLGDFLAGLFYLAREIMQREPALLQQIDHLLTSYSEDDFLAALPSLRLAFSFFLPREKQVMASTLFAQNDYQLPSLAVSIEEAARVLAFENALFKALERYGIL